MGGNDARLAALCATAALALAAPACGDEAEPAAQSDAREPAERTFEDNPADPAPRVEPVTCPADLAGCEAASGEIVYVEKVDPDGDGDAHFVLTSDESITAPGISVIDVRADLRPQPLPQPGDSLSAAGPVYPGSYGQRQIEAVEVRVARAD